jgi:hypothetical protein
VVAMTSNFQVTSGGPHPDDAARTAGSAGPAAALCWLQRDAVGLDNHAYRRARRL